LDIHGTTGVGAAVYGAYDAICPVTYSWGTVINEEVNGGTNGDPQFSGFLGQSYQIHGVSGSYYNIISTPALQLNALFTFLTEGACRKGTTCFAHAGNYFGEIGLSLKNGDKVDYVHIVAGPVAQGLKVLINNVELAVSSTPIVIGQSTITLADSFDAIVETPEFSFRFQNSDMFLNEDVTLNRPLLEKVMEFKRAVKAGSNATEAELPHGLLGQTWQRKTYSNRFKHIQGQLFDYTVDGIFGTEFQHNRF